MTRILALTLVAACSYHEPIGTSQLSSDAGGGSGDDGGAPGDGSAADPRVLTDTESCSFTQFGADLYCFNGEQVASATDARLLVRIRRVTADMHFVDEATLTTPPLYAISGGKQEQDADRIYFAAELRPETAFDPARWAIYAYDKQAHTFAPLADGFDQRPTHLFVDGGRLYFTMLEQVPANTGHDYDRVFSMPVTGGNPTLLTDALGSVADLTSDGTFLYVTDIGRYHVHAIAIAPPHRVLTLATTGVPNDTAAPAPFDVLAHGDWLYYSTQGNPDGAIHRVPRPSAHATQDDITGIDEVVAAGMIEANGMVAHDGYLYWTEYFDGLQRAPLDGGAAPETLVSFGQQGNEGPVVVGDWLYFHARHADNTGDVIAQYHLTP